MLAGRERLRAKLSYTNIGFALAPAEFSISELSAIYTAALGYPVDPTNLRRVLERRGLLEATGERRAPGREGGRPAAVYRFASRDLEVTDPFAVLRPPRPAGCAPGGADRPAHARPIFTGPGGASPRWSLQGVEQQADVERRRRVRQRADADEVDAGLRHRAHRSRA